MNKKIIFCLLLFMFLSACSSTQEESVISVTNTDSESIIEVKPTEKIEELNEGLSTIEHNGDDLFNHFLSQGGSSSDQGIVDFLTNQLLYTDTEIEFQTQGFACSTISTSDAQGNQIFGRNFDWEESNAMIVISHPIEDYSSISTVNMDFITTTGISAMAMQFSDEIKTLAALYAPLDGMNEKGLTVSINMIQDSDTIEQNTSKPDITTTTAVRLLLNKAASVEEAISLLSEYDFHASLGMMVHFAIADSQGNSAVIEYIDNEMVVTPTPVVTNFYLTDGEKYGIGSSQSHERYDILQQTLSDGLPLSMIDVRDALDSVSKDNFNEFESTEWSIVFNQTTGQVKYYHRENYTESYQFQIY